MLLAGVCTLALVDLLPLLGTSPSVTTQLVVLTLVGLVLAAAVGAVGAVLPSVRRYGTGPARRGAAPLRHGAAPDPAHHPLAPRAPEPA